MPHIRVLLGFTNAPDHTVEETAGAVISNLFTNPAFPAAPPIGIITLQGLLADFTTAINAQAQGGTAATAAKEEKRAALIAALRQLASYVQDKCGNSVANLLSSGFEAVTTSHAASPLPQPQILKMEHGQSGQLFVRVRPVPNAKCYEVRYATLYAGGTPSPWQNGGLFTNSRAIPLDGLTPGTSYTAQVRAVGGSTGYSDWSDPSSHMSM